jgi:hypothetical protein
MKAQVTRPIVFAALAVILAGFGCTHELDIQEHDGNAVSFSASGDTLFERLQAQDGWLVSDPLEATEPFERVFVMFDALTPIALEARASSDGGETFTAWTPLELTFAEEQAHNAAVDLAGESHLQLRVQAPVEAGLRFLSLSGFALDDDDAAALEGNQTSDALLRDREDVVSRSGWGGRAPRCGSARHTPNRITVHHTETPINPNVSDAARMRQIQNFHIDGRGWCDVGYHLLIGVDGRIYQGRDENRRGAHAGSGNNNNNVGISFIGSFQSQLPNASQLEAGARAIRGVADEWGIAIDRSHVFGHREMRSTDCPGQALFNFLPDLVAMARDGSSAPTPPPTVEPGCESSTLGHPVDHDSFVQVSYDACGLDTCAWFRCDAGSWSCAGGPAGASLFPNAACTAPVSVDDDTDIALVDTFPATFQGDTTGAPRDNFDRYSCSSANESGPEHVYEVRVIERGMLTVEVDDDGNTDIDLHILRTLDEDDCVTRDDERVRATLEPGTYYVVADTYVTSAGTVRDGAYTLRFEFAPTPTGACAVLDNELEMYWSSCAGSIENCTSTGGRRYLSLPATGPVVKEAHLVTTSETFSGGWPSASRHEIERHYNVSASISGYDMSRGEAWAPAGEGGSRYGQGSTGARIPVLDEAWYITMYWRQRPAGGTRMIVTNPANGRSVVASAGWETGPGSNGAIAGVTEEIHDHLGTGHMSELTVAFAADPNLPLGPIDCGGAPAPQPETLGSYDDVSIDDPAFAAIEAMRDAGVMWGCAPGQFCPNSPLQRDQLAAIVSALETSSVNVSSTPQFADVGAGHWAFAGIQELAARQITYGCGGGNYCPDNPVSRAAFAVYLRRAFDLGGVSGSTSFSDVPTSHWAASSIESAARAGVVEGCSLGLYCPDDTISRADAARLLASAYGLVE